MSTFVTGTAKKLGRRRTDGIGDHVGESLLKCTTVRDMVNWCLVNGIKNAKKHRNSKLHLGVVRMALGNMARAHFRRLEIDKRRHE